MVVTNRPPGNPNDIRLIDAWRPVGSRTVLWAQNMETNRLLHLVQWGDSIYLPVTEGLRLGIGVYNGADNMMAYPTYVEARNLFDNGASQPDACTSDQMWEVDAGDSFIMDALKNSNHRTGRPLIIVPNGQGLGIGEATYGTDAYHGQIRVYERSVIGETSPRQPAYPYPNFDGIRGCESIDLGAVTRSAGPPTLGGTTGGGSVYRGAPRVGIDHQVGIGAGAETDCPSYDTGRRYNPDSRLVVALRVESRQDLAEILRQARHMVTQWHWTPGHSTWYTTWTPMTAPVAPHIPVAEPAPHQPYGRNKGRGVY